MQIEALSDRRAIAATASAGHPCEGPSKPAAAFVWGGWSLLLEVAWRTCDEENGN